MFLPLTPAVMEDEGFGPGNDERLITGPLASASSRARGSWRKRPLVRAFMEIRYTESAEYIIRLSHPKFYRGCLH
jgi:hypothetical protein